MRAHHGLVVLTLALGLLACGGPLVTLPGGRLSGEVVETPTDWSFSDSVETVQLETNPSDPYSVNVWGVAAGPIFYIAAGDSENTWAANVLADPLVRLRIDGQVYELSATRTDAPEELDAFLELAKKKYDFEPEPDQRDKATLFRLGPR